MADEIRITSDQLKALASKLDTIDLTEDERLVMQAVFAAAASDAEVSGFALNSYHPTDAPNLSQGFLDIFHPGAKFGIIVVQ
jgi:hypothetical protein